MVGGWIAVRREITDHAVFHKRPDRLYVWIWMIATAAYKPVKQDCDGKVVEVARGQLLTSYRQMSARTGVGIQVIRTLLIQLGLDHAINTSINTGRLLITIRNYDKYQTNKKNGNTPENTLPTQRQHTKEQVNNTPSETDPVKVMFDTGISLLKSASITERKARSLLGKWRKQHGTGYVIDAIAKAQKESAVDPVAFIEGVFRHTQKTGAGLSPTDRAKKIVQGM